MNVRDSESVAAQLVSKGYRLAPSEKTADIILLNTCSVRDQAEQKAIGKVSHLASSRKGRAPILGLMGCVAQTRGQDLIDQLPDLDLVLGTQKFHHAGEYLDQILTGERSQICDIEEEKGSQSTIRNHLFGDASPPQVSAFVSIMQGCNQHCSFCIVPFTRGHERSRSISEIVEECEELASKGTREVTLLGQIVTSYGRRERDLHKDIHRDQKVHKVQKGKSAFVCLLEAVSEVRGLERIRFTSPHPKGYGDDLIEAYRDLPKLCASAHIPLQSGSNDILRKMHRGYTRERFLKIIDKLRQVKSQIGITTDLIVAFPGETEKDFEQTLSLVREVQFDNAFVFKYSARKGTPAASLSSQISKKTKEARHSTLLQEVNEIGFHRYEKWLGKRVRILVEGASRRNPNRLQGRTDCNKMVVFEGNDRQIGGLLDLQIQRVGSFTLYGDPAIINLDP